MVPPSGTAGPYARRKQAVPSRSRSLITGKAPVHGTVRSGWPAWNVAVDRPSGNVGVCSPAERRPRSPWAQSNRQATLPVRKSLRYEPRAGQRRSESEPREIKVGGRNSIPGSVRRPETRKNRRSWARTRIAGDPPVEEMGRRISSPDRSNRPPGPSSQAAVPMHQGFDGARNRRSHCRVASLRTEKPRPMRPGAPGWPRRSNRTWPHKGQRRYPSTESGVAGFGQSQPPRSSETDKTGRPVASHMGRKNRLGSECFSGGPVPAADTRSSVCLSSRPLANCRLTNPRTLPSIISRVSNAGSLPTWNADRSTGPRQALHTEKVKLIEKCRRPWVKIGGRSSAFLILRSESEVQKS